MDSKATVINDVKYLKGNRYERRSDWAESPNANVAEFYDKDKKKRVFIKEFRNLRYPESIRDTRGNVLPGLKAAEEKAQAFYDRTVKINARLREIAHEDGDLVVSTDFFREGLSLYKVSELIEMEPWTASEVRDHLSIDQIDLLMQRLSNALQALHSAGVLHCDLKPENVFLTRDRDGYYVGMLSDFDDSFLLSELPDKKSIVCTLEYLSPELGCYKSLEGDEPEMPLGPQSDVFTLGMVYHEYLAGDIPSFSSDYHQLYAALTGGQPLELSDALDPAHKLLLYRMMTTMPEDRLQSCAEVRSEIAAIRYRRDAAFDLKVMNGGKAMANTTLQLWAHFQNSGELSEKQHVKLCDVRTDGRGQVQLTGLTECEYTLRLGDVEMPIKWEGSGKRFSATVQMARTRRYTLTILHDDKPVAGKPVTLTHYSEARVKQGTYTARTDARGVAVFEDLPEGIWQAEVDKVRQTFRWDDACAHTFVIRTFTLTLMKGSQPAAGEQVELVGRSDAGSSSVTLRSDSNGNVALHNLNMRMSYAVRYQGRELPLTWSADRRAEVQLAVRTKVSIGVVMEGTKQPVVNAVVCIGRMSGGRFAKLAEGRTDARGMADLGAFDEGEYLVGVMQMPAGVSLAHQKVGQAVRMNLSGASKSAAFVARRDTEGIVLDEDIPQDVSSVYSHIVRYRDGGVVLTCRGDGSTVTTRVNQLALKGLEDYM